MPGPNERTGAHTVRDFPERLEDENGSELVGVDAKGNPQYYDPVEERIAPAYEARGELVPRWQDARELGPDATLSDVVDEIADAIGWAELVDDE